MQRRPKSHWAVFLVLRTTRLCAGHARPPLCEGRPRDRNYRPMQAKTRKLLTSNLIASSSGGARLHRYFPMVPAVELSAPRGIRGPMLVRPPKGDAMRCYRIYMLDHKHRVVTGSDVDCLNDEAALAWAATTLGTDPRAEVWQRTRFVGRVSSVSVPLDTGQALADAGD
jgi:hypothetical protein